MNFYFYKSFLGIANRKKILFNSSLLVISLSVFMTSCVEDDAVPTDVSKDANTYTAEVATKWFDLELKLIKTTAGYTPPVAARALAYTGLTLYETVEPGMSGYQTLTTQIKDLTSVPKIEVNKEYHWALAANSAQHILLKLLFATSSDANKRVMDSLRTDLEASLKVGVKQGVIDRSVKFGEDMAIAIFNYSRTDGGHEAYSNVYPIDYIVPTGLGKWEPTSAQKIPMLPYWGKNRQFVAANANVNPPPPYDYSTTATSDFYKEASEVFTISKSLTTAQKDIALFWADGGGTITPPGHHANIATIVLKKENAKLDKAAETYAKVCMAVSDAFVSCWKCKYTYNLMRPQTYIRFVFDATWTPLIGTPPFPEYTSGHSSGSGAASQTLTDLFGDNYAFTDNTWDGTFANRSFSSFFAYADEATISRLYGGIHYRSGNEKGIANGKLIGKNISALRFKK